MEENYFKSCINMISYIIVKPLLNSTKNFNFKLIQQLEGHINCNKTNKTMNTTILK
jgi:hypothetical protein